MTSHTSKVIVVDDKNAFGDETGPPIAPRLLGFSVCVCVLFRLGFTLSVVAVLELLAQSLLTIVKL